MPKYVLDNRDGDAPLEELGCPGVPQDVRVGEITGDAGFFSPLVEHPPEVPLVHSEDPALLVRKVHEIVRHAARDVWRNGDAPDGFLRRFLLQDPEPDLVVPPVDVVLVVDELDLPEACPGEPEGQVGEPVLPPAPSLCVRPA